MVTINIFNQLPYLKKIVLMGHHGSWVMMVQLRGTKQRFIKPQTNVSWVKDGLIER